MQQLLKFKYSKYKMTDFLVDPVIGQTRYKIDPLVQNENTLWPSAKMLPLAKEIPITGTTAAHASTGKWTLKNGATIVIPTMPSDGLYHFYAKHSYPNAFGPPLGFSYAVNTGPFIPLGTTYYSNNCDLGIFLSLKMGDTLTLSSPTVTSGYTVYPSYSTILTWGVRKLK